MNLIDPKILNAQPEGTCKECRKRICQRNNMIAEAIAAVLFSKETYPYQFEDEAGRIAIDHLRSCNVCLVWFRHIIPEEIVERNEKMTFYCCGAMFCAVEESELHSLPRFSFETYRDDELWRIDRKLACPRYCPWCGNRLPDRPFRSYAQQAGDANAVEPPGDELEP